MAGEMTAPVKVRAEDEKSHYQKLPADHIAEHFQDHIGIGVIGRSGGKDILVASTIYHVGGRSWGVKDAAVIQTNFMVSDPQNRKMGDNPFVGSRLDTIGGFDNFEVVEDGDAVVWKAGNRQTICRPPVWEIKGEHMGVEVDIRLTGIGDALPYRGPWEQLAETGMAGNELLCNAEGSITYDGVTYVLDEAWAVRERMCLGKDRDVMSLLGSTPGYLWGWLFSDDFKMFCHSVGSEGQYSARVYLKDKLVEYGPGDVTVEPLEFWMDPKSNVTYPVRWKIEINSDHGTLSVESGIWSRCLFGFFQLKGYSLHMSALGRSTGEYTDPDGNVMKLDDVLSYFDQGKATLLPAGL